MTDAATTLPSLPSFATVTEKGSLVLEQLSGGRRGKAIGQAQGRTEERATEKGSDLHQKEAPWIWVPAPAGAIKPWYLGVVLMKDDYQPPTNELMHASLTNLLANEADCQAVQKIVLIKNDSMMYYDISRLHNWPHGGISKAEDITTWQCGGTLWQSRGGDSAGEKCFGTGSQRDLLRH